MSNKIRSATDQRSFTIVYDDFLESTVLDHYEKLIFIAIKKFTNETLKAFPSLKKLSKMTSISESKIRRCIDHMQELGVLEVERRYDFKKGQQSNLYTLFDFSEIWEVEQTTKDIIDVKEKIDEAKMIAELRRLGYTVEKEKEPEKAKPPINKVVANSSSTNSNSKSNNITQKPDSQELKYSIEDIKAIFDYDLMLEIEPLMKDEIESVLNILFDALNTKKSTIRISGEEKPVMVVVAKLLKLDCYEILYCIKKFSEQTEKIKNAKSYMLTLLYTAKEQMNLELTNKINSKN